MFLLSFLAMNPLLIHVNLNKGELHVVHDGDESTIIIHLAHL